jgi:hypothetical protein
MNRCSGVSTVVVRTNFHLHNKHLSYSNIGITQELVISYSYWFVYVSFINLTLVYLLSCDDLGCRGSDIRNLCDCTDICD